MAIEMRINAANVLWTRHEKPYSGYQKFPLALEAGCFGWWSIPKHYEWHHEALNETVTEQRKALVGIILITASSHARGDDVILNYADKYLEFVHNSDRGLPMFTSILRVRLSILKHKYRIKLWSSTLQSGHSIWFDETRISAISKWLSFFSSLVFQCHYSLRTNGILSKLPTNMTNIWSHTLAYRSCTVAVLGMISFKLKELLNQCIFAGL